MTKVAIFTVSRVLYNPGPLDLGSGYYGVPAHAFCSLSRAVHCAVNDAHDTFRDEQKGSAEDLPSFHDELDGANKHFAAFLATPLGEDAEAPDTYEITFGRHVWVIGGTVLDTRALPGQGNGEAMARAIAHAIQRNRVEYTVGPTDDNVARRYIDEGAVTGRMDHPNSHIEDIPKESIERPLAPSAAEVVGEVVVPGEAPLNNATIEEN